MNIRFSLHSTLHWCLRFFGITSQNRDIILTSGKEVPRSTHICMTFKAIEVDWNFVTYQLLVLHVRMSASSLSLFGALFLGLVIFYIQNDYFRRCFGHQKKKLSVPGFLPAPANNLTAGLQIHNKETTVLLRSSMLSTQLICISRQTNETRGKPFTAAAKSSSTNTVGNIN